MRKFRTYHEVESLTGDKLVKQVVDQRERLERRLAGVRYLVAIASGKGGVGKSAVTANLAAALAVRGLEVGVVDADLNGPSLARMLGVSNAKLVDGENGVVPPRLTVGCSRDVHGVAPGRRRRSASLERAVRRRFSLAELPRDRRAP